MRISLTFLAALVLCHAPLVVCAQEAPMSSEDEEQIDRRARRISSQVMSPFCPGRVLSECPSPSAGEWREDIRTWLEDGVPAPEIRERLESRVPDANLRGRPKSSGGWTIVFIGLALSLLLPALLLRKRLKRGGDSAQAGANKAASEKGKASDAMDARLDEELNQLD